MFRKINLVRNLLKSTKLYTYWHNNKIIQSINIFHKPTCKYWEYLCIETLFKRDSIWVQQDNHPYCKPNLTTIHPHTVKTLPKSQTNALNWADHHHPKYTHNNIVRTRNSFLYWFNNTRTTHISVISLRQDWGQMADWRHGVILTQ